MESAETDHDAKRQDLVLTTTPSSSSTASAATAGSASGATLSSTPRSSSSSSQPYYQRRFDGTKRRTELLGKLPRNSPTKTTTPTKNPKKVSITPPNVAPQIPDPMASDDEHSNMPPAPRLRLVTLTSRSEDDGNSDKKVDNDDEENEESKSPERTTNSSNRQVSINTTLAVDVDSSASPCTPPVPKIGRAHV